jgi:hypothetical protein
MISGQVAISCQRSAKVSERAKAVLAPFKIRLLVGLAILLLVSGGLIPALEAFLENNHLISRAVAAPKNSIAVLPFESLSENKNDTCFADYW